MSIKFLLDENIPYALIDFLENKGFSVEHLKMIGKGGIILLKLTITKTGYLLKIIGNFLNKYQDKLSAKHLIILEDNIVRIY